MNRGDREREREIEKERERERVGIATMVISIPHGTKERDIRKKRHWPLIRRLVVKMLEILFLFMEKKKWAFHLEMSPK